MACRLCLRLCLRLRTLWGFKPWPSSHGTRKSGHTTATQQCKFRPPIAMLTDAKNLTPGVKTLLMNFTPECDELTARAKVEYGGQPQPFSSSQHATAFCAHRTYFRKHSS
eukprot:6209280-Pleurochrysis_carterae.AAC.1